MSKDYKKETITFPQDLYDLTLAKAKSLGLSFDEYIKKVIEKEVSFPTQSGTQKTKKNHKYFLAKDEDEMRMQGF